MCGVAGLLASDGATADRLMGAASRMGAALAHRGPDDSDVWYDAAAGVALAHRRLAILDLSEQGHQPMVSADGRYVLAFCGEIYNHQEMARELAAAHVRLRGHSDTEVLLETFARRPVQTTLQAANGMFAFALWDRETRTLTLGRDRLGEKPLYYAWLGDELVFASELKALQRHPRFTGRVSAGAVALFVRHSYIPGPHTIYEDVHKLPPGHILTVRAGATDARPQPFWSLEETARSGRASVLRGRDEAIVDEAESLLRDAVRLRMGADVPLGAFLSGGVDSSLVVALMQQVADRPVRTFTVSVGGQYDESGHAASVARHLGTEHTEIHLAESDALDLAGRVPEMYDEPFADPSAVPTALVCAAARQHVTVCLTGDGGDEVLAGYNRYLAADASLTRMALVPSPIRRGLASTLLRVPPARWDAIGSLLLRERAIPDLGTKLHKAAGLVRAPEARSAYRALTTNLDPAAVLRDPTEPPTAATARSPAAGGLDGLHMMLYLDGVMTLPDDMLVKVDRASMAVSLECRVPLLDHRFVELAWRLPTDVKIRGRQGKWLLRQILRRHVPESLFARPKQGFDPPIADWLRGPLRPWVGDLLAQQRLQEQGIFDADAVRTVVDQHLSGRRNHDYALWTLLMFQSWLDHQSVPAAA